ncbi:magnesium transporter NIPA-domain-containing protein [Neurospora hispaniola]|uniref:Magnesium transporter NIPA-domain-containing protein n=1 Tax=Neurospora hispaniola TaxID=588809 RepID=A0AAJ0I9M7_9PEZI|nr:magnesium transporter NIPA-domain-containing protein [Neurospora hispaniola]
MRLPAPASAAGLWPMEYLPDVDIPPADGGDHGNDEGQNWSSLIGIITAICGNILIALALNVQRYAHIRLNHHRAEIRRRAKQALREARANANGTISGSGGIYGTTAPVSDGALSRKDTTRRPTSDLAIDAHETEPLTRSSDSTDSGWSESSTPTSGEIKVTTTYLKDPYWWLGQGLITVGETGNFLAYGFAPASVVSPLGVVALVSNCIIAPIFFKEVFRRRDFFGVLIAVAGAVIVVLSAESQETKMGPHEVWDAITTMEFEIYMGLSCSLIVLLMWASPRYGNRTILIDLGLVGLFGGYTALSTKGVSSMLSSTLLGAFTTPITYVLIFVLLFTAVMQVHYVNKALRRFDSTQVIPVQFVLFTLSVIIGSAVLYRDFERTTSKQVLRFIGGCMLTFFGVFLITSGRPHHDEEEEEEEILSDAEGIDETIGLAEQGPTLGAAAAIVAATSSPHTPRQSSRRRSDSTRSRRSSRISFKEASVRPLSAVEEAEDTGLPSRTHTRTKSQKTLIEESDDDDNEDAPLLGNPWRAASSQERNRSEEYIPEIDAHYHHPGIGPHTISSDTILSIPVSSDEFGTDLLSTTPQPNITITCGSSPAAGSSAATRTPPSASRPATPRAPVSSSTLSQSHRAFNAHVHHYGHHHHHNAGGNPLMISPSPFSSTLGAVVADRLLPHLGMTAENDSPTQRRIAGRRSRPGLRNSLFVPQDELDNDDGYFDLENCRGRGRRSAAVGSTSTFGPLLDLTGLGGNGSKGEGQRGPGQGHGDQGIRGRARSLSGTLAELLGGGWRMGGGGGGGSSHVSTSATAATSSGNNGSNPTMRVPNASSRSRMGMKRRRTDPNFRVIRNGGETRVTEDGEVEGDEEGQGSRLETTRSAAV